MITLNKKNRLAIVLSIFWMLGVVFFGLVTAGGDDYLANIFVFLILFGLPVYVYWGYRFYKGDLN